MTWQPSGNLLPSPNLILASILLPLKAHNFYFPFQVCILGYAKTEVVPREKLPQTYSSVSLIFDLMYHTYFAIQYILHTFKDFCFLGLNFQL